jgi:hypothetical protein
MLGIWPTGKKVKHTAVSEPLEIISIMAASMLKFAISPLVSFKLGYGFLHTLLLTSAGGCLSTILFYKASGWLMARARLRRMRRSRQGHLPHTAFTRTNRLLVRLKRGQGLQGLAAIVPPLLSIPIGTVLAAKYFRNDRRTLPVLLGSVVLWSVVLTTLWSVPL